jgi:hypothetical protein
MVEGIYGPIIFGKALGRIETFNAIKRDYKGRYGAHMVHLRKPLLEWAGPDLVKIDMRISLNAAWCGDPNMALMQWHALCENGMAAPLIVGGRPMGPGLSLFVATEVSEQHKHWLSGGRLIAVEVDVHFEEYIPFADIGGLAQILSGAVAGALGGPAGSLGAIAGFGGQF